MRPSTHRRLAVAVTLVGLVVAGAVALPSTAARFSAQTRNPDASSFEAGEFGPLDGLEQLVAAAVCAAQPDAPVCAPQASAEADSPWLLGGSTPAPAPMESVPPALSAPSPSPRGPRPSQSPTPSSLPEPGERCETPDCVEEAVHVVGAFAEELQQLREAEPERVPEQAVDTIAAFAEELRAMPEPPEEDLPLPEDTREALGELVEAGVLPAFTPECVANVGQLAALIAEQQAAQQASRDGDPGASPSPTPTATCTPAEPTPEPQPQATPSPEPGVEPEPAPTGEPDESPYPHDGPGHRVRRVEPED